MPELDLGLCSAPNYKLICIGCLRLPRETQEAIYREKTEQLRGQLFPWVTIFIIYKGKYTTEAGHLILITHTHNLHGDNLQSEKNKKKYNLHNTLYFHTHSYTQRNYCKSFEKYV